MVHDYRKWMYILSSFCASRMKKHFSHASICVIRRARCKKVGRANPLRREIKSR
jgi:hypothetical protein